METERIDNATENTDNNVDKNAKLKNIAVKTAKFAGSVGAGMAGTMATNAMKTDNEDTENTAENKDVQINQNPEAQEEIQEEIITQPVVEFNPDDIVIDVDGLILPDNYYGSADMDGLTVIDDGEQIFDDEFEVDVFLTDDEEELYAEELYADDDDISEDPDILDDFLA